MSTVVKDINESSEKIDEVKRIVKDRALALEYKKADTTNTDFRRTIVEGFTILSTKKHC